jgi:hypothetical protein
MQSNKRYWLRGALIAVFVFVLLFVILFKPGSQCSGHPCIPAVFIVAFPGWIIAYLLTQTIFISSDGGTVDRPLHDFLSQWGISENVFVFTLCLIMYFLIGSLIGYFYGKIKNR